MYLRVFFSIQGASKMKEKNCFLILKKKVVLVAIGYGNYLRHHYFAVDDIKAT